MGSFSKRVCSGCCMNCFKKFHYARNFDYINIYSGVGEAKAICPHCCQTQIFKIELDEEEIKLEQKKNADASESASILRANTTSALVRLGLESVPSGRPHIPETYCITGATVETMKSLVGKSVSVSSTGIMSDPE